MCLCMYGHSIYVTVCVYECISFCMCIYECIFVCISVCVCRYVYLCICVSEYVTVCLCLCISPCASMHTAVFRYCLGDAVSDLLCSTHRVLQECW